MRQLDFFATNGKTLAQTCKEAGRVEQAYYWWSNIYCGMKVDQV
jgi:putative transposase